MLIIHSPHGASRANIYDADNLISPLTSSTKKNFRSVSWNFIYNLFIYNKKIRGPENVLVTSTVLRLGLKITGHKNLVISVNFWQYCSVICYQTSLGTNKWGNIAVFLWTRYNAITDGCSNIGIYSFGFLQNPVGTKILERHV